MEYPHAHTHHHPNRDDVFDEEEEQRSRQRYGTGAPSSYGSGPPMGQPPHYGGGAGGEGFGDGGRYFDDGAPERYGGGGPVDQGPHYGGGGVQHVSHKNEIGGGGGGGYGNSGDGGYPARYDGGGPVGQEPHFGGGGYGETEKPHFGGGGRYGEPEKPHFGGGGRYGEPEKPHFGGDGGSPMGGGYGNGGGAPEPPVVHVSHEGGGGGGYGGYQQGPEPLPQYENENKHHHHSVIPSFGHHTSHATHGGASGGGGGGRFNGRPTVRVYSKAEMGYSLTIRNGDVVLARSDPTDEFQHWIKDEKYSTRVKDEERFPSFSLVNKATGQALKHSIAATQPVQLTQYNPDTLEQSVLWTESNDLGDGYRCIRMVNNIKLNLDAFNGDEKHGGVHDGTKVVLWEWKKGANQRWKISPY